MSSILRPSDGFLRMIRGRVVGALAVKADDHAASSAREAPDQVLFPTLDERANLYLRAVHGDRDFTRQELRSARTLILEAMAADIAARSDARSPPVEGAALPSQFPAGVDHERLTAFADASLVIAALESGREAPTIDRSASGLGFHERQAADRDVEDPGAAAGVPPRALSQRWLPPSLSAGRVANRIAPVFVAAALAAVVGYWTGRIFPMTPATTARGDVVQVALPSAPFDPPIMAQVQREVASALNAAHLRPDEIAALLKYGQELVADGQFRLARLVLGRAAEAGSAPAALAVGRTYDPMLAERPGVRPDEAPDIAMARVWYEKATELGSVAAARRLSELPAPVPASRSSSK